MTEEDWKKYQKLDAIKGKLILAFIKFQENIDAMEEDAIRNLIIEYSAIRTSINPNFSSEDIEKELSIYVTLAELNLAEQEAERLKKSCDSDTADLEDLYNTMENEGKLHPYTSICLALDHKNIKELRDREIKEISNTNSLNAKKKGEPWRQEAYRLFKEWHGKKPSYAEFARRYEYKNFTHTNGEMLMFPSSDQIKRGLSAAIKERDV